MAKLSTDELLEAFKEMTLIELSEFVKQFEDTFGVTAAAPVAVAAAGAPAGGAHGRTVSLTVVTGFSKRLSAMLTWTSHSPGRGTTTSPR